MFKYKLYFPLLLLFIFFLSLASAQIPRFCSSDRMRSEIAREFPSRLKAIGESAAKLENFTQNYSSKKNQIYTIPVVFHIIHNYGIENIDAEQILDAMRILNLDFRKRNPDTALLVPAFKSIAADCEIEFRLAQKDPYGNCTSGITRTVSTFTYTGTHNVKSLIQWPPDKYMNIYVVADAAGLAGHSIFPSDADTVPQWDGIVIRHDYVGSIGTSTPLTSVVLAHETGHYLNLQHTWGGNNVPGYVYYPPGDTSNCGRDDGVTDTPNTIGWDQCNLSGKSCGSALDNVQNFMEYSYCNSMFTQGQKLRMHAALNSNEGHRNNLWQAANLIATGTDGPSQLCSMEIHADQREICQGAQVQFSVSALHDSITSYQWLFPGGTPSSSALPKPLISYLNPGDFDVSLQISSGSGSLLTQKNHWIHSLHYPGLSFPFFEGFESSAPQVIFYSVDTSKGWNLNNTAAYTGSGCVKFDNFNNSTAASYDIESPAIDLSSCISVNLSFKCAFTGKPSTTQDKIQVYVSNDCGMYWNLKQVFKGATLVSASGTSSPFVPSSTSDWKTFSVININSSFFVPNFRFKLVFTGAGGNDIYIDDISLNGIAAGVRNMQDENTNAYVYVSDQVNYLSFSLKKNANVSIQVFDALSRPVNKIMESKRFSEGEYQVPLIGMKQQGFYYVYLKVNDSVIVKKFVFIE